jgi:hypothetical protein
MSRYSQSKFREHSPSFSIGAVRCSRAKAKTFCCWSTRAARRSPCYRSYLGVDLSPRVAQGARDRRGIIFIAAMSWKGGLQKASSTTSRPRKRATGHYALVEAHDFIRFPGRHSPVEFASTAGSKHRKGVQLMDLVFQTEQYGSNGGGSTGRN